MGAPGVGKRFQTREQDEFFTSKIPLVCRKLSVGCIYHSRVRRSNCFLANSGSTIANGMQWEAVSHAAKNGYSHESGMERMSSMKR